MGTACGDRGGADATEGKEATMCDPIQPDLDEICACVSRRGQSQGRPSIDRSDLVARTPDWCYVDDSALRDASFWPKIRNSPRRWRMWFVVEAVWEDHALRGRR